MTAAVAAAGARLGVEVVGETIEGIFGLASATVTAAGEAAKGVGTAVGGALEGALSPTPITIVNNVGMAGQAAKAKVTGGGTIPAAPKKSAKPIANAKMPIEKLLVIAVNYLSSIEKTLVDQLNFERTAFAQQAVAEREAAIENDQSTTSPFKSLGEKLGAYKDDVKDRASMMTKVLLGSAVLGTFGLLGLGEMDKSELDRLKSAWAEFSDQWKFVTDILKPVIDNAGWGTFLGYMLFGARGAVAGWLFDYIKNVTGGSDLAAWTAGITSGTALGVFGKAARTAMFTSPLGAAGVATAVTFSAAETAFTYTQTTEQKKITDFFKKYGLYVEKWSDNGLAAMKYAISIPERNINERGILRAALDGSKSRTDKYYYWHMVTEASYVRGGTATRAQAWLDSTDAQAWLNQYFPIKTDAVPVPSAQTVAGDDAAPAVTTSPSPDATSLPPAATGSIDAILDKKPEDLSDAELRQLVEAQGRIEDPSGVTNNPGGILYGTGPLQENQIAYRGANADSSVKIAVYDTPENGIRAAMLNWRNSRYYRGKTVREGLGTWSGGNGAHYARMLGSSRPGYEGTNNPQGETGSSMASSLVDLSKGAMEAIGTIIRAGLGSDSMTPTSGSQLSGFNDTMSGNVERSAADMPSASGGSASAAAPIQGESAVTAALARTSAQIQNAVDLGNADAAQTATQQESAGASSIRQANASNDGKLECLDPNFPGDGAVEAYLQYHRLAA